jgi:hypothetical protein
LTDPIKYSPDVTHEFMAYSLGEGEQIDFDRNLWDQRNLSPRRPAVVAFQFKASGDEDAKDRISAFLQRCMRDEAVVNLKEQWLANFPGAVDLSTPLLDDEKIAIAQVDARHAKKRPIPPPPPKMPLWMTQLPSMSRTVGSFAFKAAVLVGIAVVIAGSVMPAMDFAESMGIKMPYQTSVQRTLEFPDGARIVVEMTRKFGSGEVYHARVISMEQDKAPKEMPASY